MFTARNGMKSVEVLHDEHVWKGQETQRGENLAYILQFGKG